MFGPKESKDPAELLAPAKDFRKANESSGSLWQKDNEYGLYDKRE